MSEFSYARLTDEQKREWHADVYAFRRIILSVPHAEHTSPTDPNGEWFDEAMVAEAMRRLRAKLQGRRATE